MKRKLLINFIIIICLLSVLPNLIQSQTNQDNNIKATQTNRDLFQFSDPKEQKGPNYFTMFIKTLFILGVFGVVIYYVFKYISKKQGLSFPKLNVLNIITSLPIGTNRFIQIIEVGKTYYLIGSTENQINLLDEITDKELIDRINVLKNKKEVETEPVSFAGFMNEIFGNVIKKLGSKDQSGFLKKQKDRLKNLHIKM